METLRTIFSASSGGAAGALFWNSPMVGICVGIALWTAGFMIIQIDERIKQLEADK